MDFNYADYYNFFDYRNLELEQLLSSCLKQELHFFKYRNNDAEYKIQWPSFVLPFYTYCATYSKVPSQCDFFVFYLGYHKKFFFHGNYSNDLIKGVQARIHRTYPSLVRDLHFALQIKKEIADVHVVYNTKLDMQHDIDVLLVKNERYIALSLFVQTKNADRARKAKKSRHKLFDNVEYKQLEISVTEVEKNELALYSSVELHKVRQILL
jgi:hypothetical protein